MSCAITPEEMKGFLDKLRKCRDDVGQAGFLDLPELLPPRKELEEIMSLTAILLISHRSCSGGGNSSGEKPPAKSEKSPLGGRNI